MEQFLKDKKKAGLCALIFIVLIICAVKYMTSGFMELKKNDTENIFVEENYEEDAAEDSNSNKDAEVFNTKTKNKIITVEIKGEVKNPDVYTLDDECIIKDLIEKAGGLTENADLSNINRAKKLQDHELIYIGNKNDTAADSTSEPAVKAASSTGGASSSSGKININTADVEALKKINGIGDSKAKSIISYRETNGNFSSIEDLKNVDGIGEKMFEKMKDMVEV